METTIDFYLEPKVVRSDEGEKYAATGTILQQKLTSSDTGGQYGFHISEVQPGFGPPMHIHTLEDELFYVLEGQIEFMIGDQTIVATQGTTIFAPRGVRHKFRGMGNTVSKMVGLVTGSNFERFYAKFSAATLNGAPDIAEIKRIAEEHGIILVPG